jgi:hypothetical protein
VFFINSLLKCPSDIGFNNFSLIEVSSIIYPSITKASFSSFKILFGTLYLIRFSLLVILIDLLCYLFTFEIDLFFKGYF